MMRQGRLVRSRTDYILGFDRQIFQNVAIWDRRHNSNHFMVVGSLSGASLREHYNCLGSRTLLTLCLPGHQTRTWLDNLFAELRSDVTKRYKRSADHNSWIST